MMSVLVPGVAWPISAVKQTLVDKPKVPMPSRVKVSGKQQVVADWLEDHPWSILSDVALALEVSSSSAGTALLALSRKNLVERKKVLVDDPGQNYRDWVWSYRIRSIEE